MRCLRLMDTITKQVFAEIKFKEKMQLIRHKVLIGAGTELLMTASKQRSKELWASKFIFFNILQKFTPLD